MDIEVRLFATLRLGRFNRQTLRVAEAATVADVCRSLKIDPQELAIHLVNGRDAEMDQAVMAGDCISLFPAIGGG